MDYYKKKKELDCKIRYLEDKLIRSKDFNEKLRLHNDIMKIIAKFTKEEREIILERTRLR